MCHSLTLHPFFFSSRYTMHTDCSFFLNLHHVLVGQLTDIIAAE